MKVEIWSDFACPFCYIGKTYFEQALKQFEHGDQIITEYKSFELDPFASKTEVVPTTEKLAEKYGISKAQAEEMTKGVAARATDAGLTFNFDHLLNINTFDAHRLMQYAETIGKASSLSEALFYAYFTDNKNLSDKEVLIEIAKSVDIDAALVLEQEQQYANEVKDDEQEAQQLGVRGVPFFVVDRKYAISGAQPTSVFVETLKKAWSERPTGFTTVNEQSGDDSCGPDGCKI